MLDAQGRLFGKISILDVGAVLVILLVILGIFVFPGTSSTSVAQIGNVTSKPVEMDVVALGLRARNAPSLFNEGDKTNLIIRNQPYGQVTITNVEFLSRNVLVPQPDGTVAALPDPRAEENYTSNLLLTLEGRGRITDDGPVIGNLKLKIGNTVELEGNRYNFNATVIDVRVRD